MTLEPAFPSGGTGPGFPVAGRVGVTFANGIVLGLFFLIGGSRFFLNGGRETDAGSSLTASEAVVVALADESTSGETVTSSGSSGSSAERESSLGRLDPTDWLRSFSRAESRREKSSSLSP
jgi:hypothetical protein